MMKNPCRGLGLAALLCGAFCWNLASADEPAAPGEGGASAAANKAEPPQDADRKTLDEELLEGLGGDPLDLDEPAANDSESTGPDSSGPEATGPESSDKQQGEAADPDRPGNRKRGPSLDEQLLEGLEAGEDFSPDSEGEESDPLMSLSRKMREVEELIAKSKSDEPTQKLQDQIVRDMAKLIKELEKRKQQSSSSSSKSKSQQTADRKKVKQPGPMKQDGQGGQDQQDQPARDSQERAGEVDPGKVDMQELKGLFKDLWGSLPERVRTQMLQSDNEHFLPKYQLEIQEYFKTLVKRRRNSS